MNELPTNREPINVPNDILNVPKTLVTKEYSFISCVIRPDPGNGPWNMTDEYYINKRYPNTDKTVYHDVHLRQLLTPPL